MISVLGLWLVLALQHVPALGAEATGLETSFRRLEFLPIQERLKAGLEGLSAHELFSAAQLLLSAASKNNETLGLSILKKLKNTDAPCIEYYRAEWLLRKGYPKEAAAELDAFLKSKEIGCDATKPDLFSCCPAAKHRNALGLKSLAKATDGSAHTANIQVRAGLVEAARLKKTPLVKWEKKVFLLDTGSEHHIWNSACAADLMLKTDSQGTYGGADSVGGTVVAHFSVPGKKIFGLGPQQLAGFAFDLESSAKEYAPLLGAGEKFCGIMAPQRLIPAGMMVFDWSAKAILFCQGAKCRKTLSLPVNCPLYQFNGRPYVNASINNEGARLFLVDTGASASSADLNYFAAPPATTTVEAEVTGVQGGKLQTSVLATAKLSYCGLGFNVKPFPVRPASRSWEWAENGKLGMNSLGETLIVLDFGQGMALIQ